MPILDAMNLEAVAEMAVELNKWEFLLTAAPLRVKDGTGSPLNAIATF
jgi:kynurenine formamidase